LEHARRRVSELRADGELHEAEIVERLTGELLDICPDWRNRKWTAKAVSDLSWPDRT
jgi:hypothetical protein